MKLLSLSIALFALSFALVLFNRSQNLSPIPTQSVSQAADLPQPTPRATLSPDNAPLLSGTAVYILDLNTGSTLFQKNADLLVSPASTTKMMTALLTSKKYNLGDIAMVPSFTIDGQKMGLIRGERISIENLLYGLLVFSANDAAETLARIYPEGREAFIEEMNKEAYKLGLTSTVFKTPAGLDNAAQVTTAREMALLGKEIMNDPFLRSVVATKSVTVNSEAGNFKHRLVSTNQLLDTVPGVFGVKTGWTEESRENLVTFVEREGHKIIISLFGSDDRFGETKKLIDWVYANTEW